MIKSIALHGRAVWPRVIVMLLACLCFSGIDAARAGPRDALLQYGHVAWRVSDGDIPGGAQALAQTSDGYIWVGTDSGLLRFDGVQFSPIQVTGNPGFSSSGVFALLAAPDGTLWVGTARGLGHVRNGELTIVPNIKGRVNDLLLDQHGTLWLARTRVPDGKGGLCRVTVTAAECFGSNALCPYSNALTSVGETIWMATTDGICSWKDNQLTTTSIATLKSKDLAGIMGLRSDSDGSLLVSFSIAGPGLGLQRLTEGRLSKVSIGDIDSETLTGVNILKDRFGGTWIGTFQGLLHVHDGKTQRIGSLDGLSGTLTQALMEDKEGDVWVGTNGGLDRFRRLPIATLLAKDGMTFDRTTVVAALRDGRVLYGSSHGLNIITGSTISKITKEDGLPGTVITAIFQSRINDAVWLGIDNQLVKYENGTFSIESGPELAGPVLAIDEDAHGTLWIDTAVRPPTRLFRKPLGRPLIEVPVQTQLLLYRMSVDASGDVWFATPTKELFRYHDGALSQIPAPSTGPICARELFAQGAADVLVLSCEGLFRYSQNQWHALTVDNGLPCNDVFSAIYDAQRRLWLGLRCGYAEISTDDLQAWQRDATHRIHPIVYGVTDGARLQASDFKSTPGLSPDGSLWFSSGGPAQMIEPASLTPNKVPPPVFIEALVANRQPMVIGQDMRLPSPTRDIEIKYVGLSFPNVRNVRFRYSLTGVDANAQEVGTRRSAFYSNLGPGHYIFNVTASNNDGVWNPVGASLSFIIPPRFYQTLWFWAVLLALLLLLIWYLLSLRIRSVAAGFELRMRERLAERDRIARELHDTLLQGLQSIVLRFQVVANLMAPEDPARELQLESLARADVVLLDVREKVRDLREAGDRPGTIVDDVKLDFEELRGASGPNFRMIVTGTVRPLVAVVRSEIQSMAKEIMFNSLQHAAATEMVCQIEFSSVRFSITLSDNGIGVSEDVLAAGGRMGHWGLVGIRERADKIRGHVAIKSDGSGTSTRVTLEGRYAYSPKRRWALGLNRFRPSNS